MNKQRIDWEEATKNSMDAVEASINEADVEANANVQKSVERTEKGTIVVAEEVKGKEMIFSDERHWTCWPCPRTCPREFAALWTPLR